MKKIFALLLMFCLLFSLIACRKTPENIPDGGSPESSSSSTDTDLPVMQKPLIAVSVPVITVSAEADDSTVIFNYIYQDEMSLTLPDADVARSVIDDFSDRVNATRATAEEIHMAAQNDYKGGDWTPYLCQLTYEPMRIDYGVLSMRGTYATYQGAARPEANYFSVTYDLTTGKVVSLSNILAEGATADVISGLVIAALDGKKEDKYLYEDFEDTIQARFADHIGDDPYWYFSKDGLCFYFSPYEIASYASGLIIAEIPYSKLTGIVKDAYFPAERDAAKGVVKMQNFDPDAFTQITELILDESAPKVMLYTDKAVYDVRIEAGGQIGEYYMPQYTIFAASSLTPGDAILLQADLSGQQELRLTYQTDNGPVSVFIEKDKLE